VKKLQAHELRQIAVAAQCDPRTVEKYLSGKLSKGVLERIEGALLSLGFQSLIRQQDAAPPVVAPEGNNDALR
jgi:hypothetical protein